jgi:hypothetical protein
MQKAVRIGKSVRSKKCYKYLSMGEDGGDMEAARALDVHEEAVRRLYQSLELVLGFFLSLRRME